MTEIRDRAYGALLGLAVGDALGAPWEFQARGTYPKVRDMTAGGPFNLEAGDWTDDTSQALCLANSIIEQRKFNPHDVIMRFMDWYQKGDMSVTGVCFDIGRNTRAALDRYAATGNPYSGSTDMKEASNGSIMRVAPIAIAWRHDFFGAKTIAENSSRLTHAAPQALGCCSMMVAAMVSAIRGGSKESSLHEFDRNPKTFGQWRSKQEREIQSDGYCVHTLKAALWAVDNTNNFEEAVIAAVNLGGDTDTVGAVAGQLAGAIYGAQAIPKRWRDQLAWGSLIADTARLLYETSDTMAAPS